MWRTALALTAALAIGLGWPTDATSHGGGLDAYGCHHNRKVGGYHCHRGSMAGQHFRSKSDALRSLQGGSKPRTTPRRRSSLPSSPQTITGQASVTDGDTIKIAGTRIRLHGIDAPERRQSCNDGAGKQYWCGRKATQALISKIGQRAVSCNRKDTDLYGRMVAVCWIGAVNLNAWMVYEGWAVAYRRYSTDYVLHEDAAKGNRRGIWTGGFTKPEKWRRTRRRY